MHELGLAQNEVLRAVWKLSAAGLSVAVHQSPVSTAAVGVCV